MGFGTLALIAVIGLAGPVLAAYGRWPVPVVLGELLVGILAGVSGVNWLHPADARFSFLAEIGFALVMFVAGTHVPVRDPALRRGASRSVFLALAVAVTAVFFGLIIAAIFHTNHAGLYAVLMASSSAAFVLPTIDSLGLAGPKVLQLVPQVALADAACIIALPLVLDRQHALRAAVGALAVCSAAGLLFAVLFRAERAGLRRKLHQLSARRKFALELRINLALLFGLASIAVHTHVSIMLAGFSFGLVVAAIGEPRRLARQIFGITEGFFGPLFFVWLGASLNLRDLVQHPSYIVLGVMLGGCAILSHLIGRAWGQPLDLSALAAAQLGVPVAAATLGTQLALLKAGEAPALLLGALITMALATAAGSHAARRVPA